MSSEYDIVGYRHWDDAKQVEYVFCVECVEGEALNVDQDNSISLTDIKARNYYCDICERTLKKRRVLSLS